MDNPIVFDKCVPHVTPTIKNIEHFVTPKRILCLPFQTILPTLYSQETIGLQVVTIKCNVTFRFQI